MLREGSRIDGYHILRFLGQGGFGVVWLCRSEAMGDYRAIKHIPTADPELLEKEYHALAQYRKAAAWLRSPHLMPVEHVSRDDAGLYYVMPLADGVTDLDPAEPGWQPQTLATVIQTRSGQASWFSSAGIIAMLKPLLLALQTITDAGLVHRDVKPDNILFMGGRPCLADISLLGVDSSQVTRRGTPGYATPSWYAGGHPDMYGAAAVLYILLTGNPPDRMGRSAFNWPPQGEASLSESERQEWKRLHAAIRRATSEKISERFVDFAAMAAGIGSQSSERQGRFRHTQPFKAVIIGLLACFIAVALFRYRSPGARTEPIRTSTKNHTLPLGNSSPVGVGSATEDSTKRRFVNYGGFSCRELRKSQCCARERHRVLPTDSGP